VAAAAVAAQACITPAPQALPESSTAVTTRTTLEEQAEIAQEALGAKISFHYSDYYSLTNPNLDNNCAGDARRYYDPIAYQEPEGQTLTTLAGETSPTGYFASTGPTGPVPYATDELTPSTTLKPAFVKNVAVDLTDANASVSVNNAFSCSLGSTPAVPPPTNCATFDYGAVGGIPTTLGGTLLMIGGVQNENYSGIYDDDATGIDYYNSASRPKGVSLGCGPIRPSSDGAVGSTGFTSCPSGVFALGVDTLPPSAWSPTGSYNLAPGLLTGPTGPISSWVNLTPGSSSGPSGPRGAAGASAVYSPELQRILLFGGASPLASQGPTGPGSDTRDTWSFDVKTQIWTYLNSAPFTANAIQTEVDFDLVAGTYLQYNKAAGARALFGYITGSRLGLVPGVTSTTTGASFDDTDRVVVIGGWAASPEESTYIRKFNPTFGPEYVSVHGQSSMFGAVPGTRDPVQWIDSSYSQMMNNGWESDNDDLDSLFLPRYPSAQTGTSAAEGATAYNFGAFPAYTSAGNRRFVALTIGGFDSALDTMTSATGGTLLFTGRWSNAGARTAPAQSIFTPNGRYGTRWASVNWTTTTNVTVPWYGGVSAHPGFVARENEFVYFGGAQCRRYLEDASSTGCAFDNDGLYLRFDRNNDLDVSTSSDDFAAGNAGSSETFAYDGTIEYDPSCADYDSGTDLLTSPPKCAGMASARGLDADDNVVIVAWGGASAAATSGDGTIFVLWDADPSTANGAVTPTWTPISTSEITGTPPTPLINATMVYSHVTKKYYVFGGYQTAGITRYSGDTWELTLAGTAPNYTASWKQLNTPGGGGLTCYPAECPRARRSHRMIEVNYHNRTFVNDNSTDGSDVIGNDPLLNPGCTSSAPCSFGIFMEGGTPDGFSLLSDRWMFDPTANGGRGHWQQVDAFPPRHHAALAPVDYFVPSQNQTVHRAVLFGGETGLANPVMAATGNYFVPPTLGDTYIYDFDTSNWYRARLYGKAYSGTELPTGPPLSDFERRQAYVIDGNDIQRPVTYDPSNEDTDFTSDSTISVLSPPPLAGAMVAVRTFPQGLAAATGPVEPLKIPEVFVFGGRLKDGSYSPLSNVYKFCMGSPGEYIPDGTANDDARCDAFDTDTNPNSTAPVTEFGGRWILKTPAGLTTITQSYLGAATYDPDNDLIVAFGGLSSDNAVTDETDREAGNRVLEYTPPSKVNGTAAQYRGAWVERRTCVLSGASAETPVGRYGHALGYDRLNHQLIMSGGYDSTGDPQTLTLTYGENEYEIPEVWTARRISQAGPVSATDPTEIDVEANQTAGFPCYYWQKKTIFGSTPDVNSQTPPSGGLSHAASVLIPASGYNSGYYTMLDNSCADAGPIATSDPQVSKLLAGGAYIDIDRSKLGAGESVILNLTYIPFGKANQRPDGERFEANETAQLRVHLVRTGQAADSLRSVLQPRHLAYAATDQFPQVVQTLSVLAPANGEVRQDQLLIPLAIDPGIDRIRIERYSGSAVLIDAGIYRMGQP
jgi:hypothetical protein